MLRLGCNYAANHRLGVPPATIQFVREPSTATAIVAGMPAVDRVRERRRAAALARHYRDEEGLSIAEIARRLGREEATVKAYLYDPSYANKRPTDSPICPGAKVSSVVIADLPVTELRRHVTLCRRMRHSPHGCAYGRLKT